MSMIQFIYCPQSGDERSKASQGFQGDHNCGRSLDLIAAYLGQGSKFDVNMFSKSLILLFP